MQIPCSANTDELILNEIQWIHTLVGDKTTSDCILLEMLIGLAEQIEVRRLGRTITGGSIDDVVRQKNSLLIASQQA